MDDAAAVTAVPKSTLVTAVLLPCFPHTPRLQAHETSLTRRSQTCSPTAPNDTCRSQLSILIHQSTLHLTFMSCVSVKPGSVTAPPGCSSSISPILLPAAKPF
eukprot:GHUV01033018.1.p2 GENE.GHUV01033018.1~~GHUV01033018.1.p2  ORF type:complete len:103 (-),score=9.56 GHUV01033018.1:1389-1697(-)